MTKAGLISEEELDEVLGLQSHRGGKLGEILVEQLVLTEDEIARVLAEQKGLDHVNLTAYPIDRSAAAVDSPGDITSGPNTKITPADTSRRISCMVTPT